MSNKWFDVNKDGWARVMADRGKAFAVFELFQNSADTEATEIKVTLDKIPGKPQARLVVEDNDPNGFCDLAHAYTLYNDSPKRANPEMRGWMDLGEKMVLAHCIEAKISSTTGTVLFNRDGTRKVVAQQKRAAGTVVDCTLRMTNEEYREVLRAVETLAPPEGITLTFNGDVVEPRPAMASFRTALPTRTVNDEGNMIRTTRQTEVKVYRPRPDETPMLYEMGIPVVPMPEDKFHVDVQQRVLVNTDRDNVPPAYLRKVRVHVLNAVYETLDKDDAAETWVTDAMGHKDVNPQALHKVLDKRHGERRAVFDPNDLEANNRLVAKGYTIIHGGTYGRDVWDNIRSGGAASAAGKISPSHKPYSDDPNAPLVDVVPRDKWTPGMQEVVAFIERLAERLMDVIPDVRIVRTSNNFSGCWAEGGLGGARLDLNLKRLGHRWFDEWPDNMARVISLVLHEFAHHYESNHLDERFYKAISDLAGKTVRLALEEHKLFQPKRRRNPVKESEANP
jgi:hypothetical protein